MTWKQRGVDFNMSLFSLCLFKRFMSTGYSTCILTAFHCAAQDRMPSIVIDMCSRAPRLFVSGSPATGLSNDAFRPEKVPDNLYLLHKLAPPLLHIVPCPFFAPPLSLDD